jgi:hypothetical protein
VRNKGGDKFGRRKLVWTKKRGKRGRENMKSEDLWRKRERNRCGGMEQV